MEFSESFSSFDVRTRDTALDALASKASACALGYFTDPYLLGQQLQNQKVRPKQESPSSELPEALLLVPNTSDPTASSVAATRSSTSTTAATEGVATPSPPVANANAFEGAVYRGPSLRRSPIMNRGIIHYFS